MRNTADIQFNHKGKRLHLDLYNPLSGIRKYMNEGSVDVFMESEHYSIKDDYYKHSVFDVGYDREIENRFIIMKASKDHEYHMTYNNAGSINGTIHQVSKLYNKDIEIDKFIGTKLNEDESGAVGDIEDIDAGVRVIINMEPDYMKDSVLTVNGEELDLSQMYVLSWEFGGYIDRLNTRIIRGDGKLFISIGEICTAHWDDTDDANKFVRGLKK